MTGYEALRNKAAWMDFTPRGKIRVTGEDAGRLLHAMTTNHVKNLAAGAGLYAFFLNDKGRILADATIFRLADTFWLDTEAETAPKIHHLLDRYIIADDAAVEDETQRWFAVGIEGPDSAAVLEQLDLPVPQSGLEISSQEWGYVARMAATGPLGFRIWADESKRESLWSQLVQAGIPQAMPEEVKAVRLENGIPRYGEDISERYLVQETRAMHAVNFEKGCYLGQEIVERVRSRGQVHRLLTPLRIDTTLAVPDGTKLAIGDIAVGEITSSAYSLAWNQVVALGYVRSETIASRAEMAVAGTDPVIVARVA